MGTFPNKINKGQKLTDRTCKHCSARFAALLIHGRIQVDYDGRHKASFFQVVRQQCGSSLHAMAGAFLVRHGEEEDIAFALKGARRIGPELQGQQQVRFSYPVCRGPQELP